LTSNHLPRFIDLASQVFDKEVVTLLVGNNYNDDEIKEVLGGTTLWWRGATSCWTIKNPQIDHNHVQSPPNFDQQGI